MTAAALLPEGPEQRLLSPDTNISKLWLSFEFQISYVMKIPSPKLTLKLVDTKLWASDLSLCFFFLHFSAALKSRSSVKSFDQQLSFHLFVPMKKKEGGRRWQNQLKKSSQMFVFKHSEASFSPFSVYFWVSDKILCAPGSETAFVTRRAILKALYSWFSVSILNYQWESNIFSVALILTWPQAYNVRRAGN